MPQRPVDSTIQKADVPISDKSEDEGRDDRIRARENLLNVGTGTVVNQIFTNTSSLTWYLHRVSTVVEEDIAPGQFSVIARITDGDGNEKAVQAADPAASSVLEFESNAIYEDWSLEIETINQTGATANVRVYPMVTSRGATVGAISQEDSSDNTLEGWEGDNPLASWNGDTGSFSQNGGRSYSGLYSVLADDAAIGSGKVLISHEDAGATGTGDRTEIGDTVSHRFYCDGLPNLRTSVFGFNVQKVNQTDNRFDGYGVYHDVNDGYAYLVVAYTSETNGTTVLSSLGPAVDLGSEYPEQKWIEGRVEMVSKSEFNLKIGIDGEIVGSTTGDPSQEDHVFEEGGMAIRLNGNDTGFAARYDEHVLL